jgi:hypothetical protein
MNMNGNVNRVQRFTLGAILGVFSSFSFAANQLMEYSIQDALNTEDARLRLGDSVQFYFGEKPANMTGRAIVVSKVRRKTMRNKDNACHWAFLSSMLKLKEEAIKRNSRYVVNIASNYQNNLIISKDKYQCALGLVAAEVALKGEIMESSATLTDVGSNDSNIVSKPVDMSNAVLIPEPINTQGKTQSQAQPPVSSVPPIRSSVGRSVEERLQVLKELYEAGEIDQKAYEAQRQRVLDGI